MRERQAVPISSFKQLTIDNWAEPDPTSGLFTRLSPATGMTSMDGNDWARRFLAIELNQRVPPEVADLFAVARGTLLYGWFFYPLFALGEEQLHRVAETAVRMVYATTHGPAANGTFKKRLAWLFEHELIGADREPRWDAIRNLRNYGSHPEHQLIITPGQALQSLTLLASEVSALFTP